MKGISFPLQNEVSELGEQIHGMKGTKLEKKITLKCFRSLSNTPWQTVGVLDVQIPPLVKKGCSRILKTPFICLLFMTSLLPR